MKNKTNSLKAKKLYFYKIDHYNGLVIMLQRFSIKKMNLHLGLYIYIYIYRFHKYEIHHAIFNRRSMIFCLNIFLLLFLKTK